MPDVAACQTTAGQVAGGGLGALIFGGLMGLWALYLERTGGMGGWRAAERWKRPGMRIWNWSITGLFVAGGVVALVVAAVMGLSGTTFSC